MTNKYTDTRKAIVILQKIATILGKPIITSIQGEDMNTEDCDYILVAEPRHAFTVKGKPGLLAGPLAELITYGMTKTSVRKRINYTRAYELYLKDNCPGLVRIEYHSLYVVNKKAFLKWVKRASTRILMSFKEKQIERIQMEGDEK